MTHFCGEWRALMDVPCYFFTHFLLRLHPTGRFFFLSFSFYTWNGSSKTAGPSRGGTMMTGSAAVECRKVRVWRKWQRAKQFSKLAKWRTRVTFRAGGRVTVLAEMPDFWWRNFEAFNFILKTSRDLFYTYPCTRACTYLKSKTFNKYLIQKAFLWKLY